MGRILRVVDVCLVFFAGYLVYQIQYEEFLTRGNFQLFLVILAVLTFNIFSAFSVYRIERGDWFNKELTRLTVAWVTVVLCIGALTFLTKTGEGYSRLWAGWTFVTIYVLMVLSRVMVHGAVRYLRAQGYNQKRVVIVGAGVLGKRACNALLHESWVGLRPVAFFDDDASLVGLRHKGIEVKGVIDDVLDFIEHNRQLNLPIDQVWIALPLTSVEKIEEIQAKLQDTATHVFLVPDVFGFNLASYKVNEVAGLPIMNMSAAEMIGPSAVVKRLEDVVLSSVLLVVLSPLFLVVAILIKKESPGPVFFKQRRYGQDGREFLVWKFRSMTVTEDGNDVVQATRNDSRVTKIGALLRKTSMDELPQLINVLMGSMSLVGPRPHAVAHNEYYRKKVQGYMTRHQIKPGITGWAQVNGCRGETSKIEDMEQRIQYDLEYIRNWTVFLDLRILFQTIPTLINNKNTY